MVNRFHNLIKENAPSLYPTAWYGMPAYYRDDRIICFFQNSQKFKTRYAALDFSRNAHLDEGSMWPTSFAITNLDENSVENIEISRVKMRTG
jgi:uncharacterized protein YdhG (YjbR/CyaY superfamily)